jgi:hypothetical protein
MDGNGKGDAEIHSYLQREVGDQACQKVAVHTISRCERHTWIVLPSFDSWSRSDHPHVQPISFAAQESESRGMLFKRLAEFPKQRCLGRHRTEVAECNRGPRHHL